MGEKGMTIDLTAMSKRELKKLLREIDTAIADFDQRGKRQVLAEIEAHARELGFNLSELLGNTSVKTRKSAVAKYADPDNASTTWSGRGRQPTWFKTALANGMTPESLAI